MMHRENWVRLFSVLLPAVVGCAKPEQSTVRDRQDERPRQTREPEPRPDARPSSPAVEPSADPTSMPDDAPPQADARSSDSDAPAHRAPRRPVDNWVIFREAFRPREDASCETRWLGANQFEIHTQNIKRLTIDLTQLPDDAPKKGPWIVQIDGQGVEFTGFRPGPGYTGMKRDLVRSQNGEWRVDKTRKYRAGE